MKHLYIDTNVYLSFFHLTKDEIEELKKLILLIGREEITLHLPEQTKDEFYRNRETKIADALKRFNEEKLSNQFPQFCKDYPEFNELKNAIDNFSKIKNSLANKLNKDIEDNKLAADILIKDLFDKAFIYDTTKSILEESKYRFDVGRPPGKNKSYGDAINWETLIQEIPNEDDLYFVSDDKDFYSEINPERFNYYLLDEWKSKKNSNLIHYRRLSLFFKVNFPEVKITSDYEKELLLNDLLNSNSFAMTRSKLRQLSKFEDFSISQLKVLITAYYENDQISLIKNDKDIAEMISTIFTLNKNKLTEQQIEHINEYSSIKIG